MSSSNNYTKTKYLTVDNWIKQSGSSTKADLGALSQLTQADVSYIKAASATAVDELSIELDILQFFPSLAEWNNLSESEQQEFITNLTNELSSQIN